MLVTARTAPGPPAACARATDGRPEFIATYLMTPMIPGLTDGPAAIESADLAPRGDPARPECGGDRSL